MKRTTFLGAAFLAPSFFAFLLYPVFAQGYGVPPELSLALSGAAALALSACGVVRHWEFWRNRAPAEVTREGALRLVKLIALEYVLLAAAAFAVYTYAISSGVYSAPASLLLAAMAVYPAHCGVGLLLPAGSVVVAGRRLKTLAEARKCAARERASEERELARKRAEAMMRFPARESGTLRPQWERGAGSIFFGWLHLTWDATKLHFLFLGMTRSGKSMSIRLLMQSTLPFIGRGFGDRAVVLDVKSDQLSILAGMRLACPVYTLNPFDDPQASDPGRQIFRGAAWDIARDARSPTLGYEIAMALAPVGKDDKEFFAKAAGDLISGVMLELTDRLGEQWSFADLVRVLKSEEDMRTLFENSRHAGDRLQYFDGDECSLSVLKTLRIKMMAFDSIAAAWSRAPHKVSLTDWLRGEFVLLLGVEETIRSQLETLYRVMFLRISQLLLSLPDGYSGKNWVYLDEAQEAGKLSGLSSLLLKGAGKGVICVLGPQSVEGMREEYGPRVASSLLGQVGNVAIFRTEEEETALWEARRIGDQLRREEQASQTRSPSGESKTVGANLVKREAVLPSDIQSMPVASRRNGLPAVYLSSILGATWAATIPGNFIAKHLLPPDKSVPNVAPLSVEHQYLEPWTDEDRSRLGLNEKEEAADSTVTLPVRPRRRRHIRIVVSNRHTGEKKAS